MESVVRLSVFIYLLSRRRGANTAHIESDRIENLAFSLLSERCLFTPPAAEGRNARPRTAQALRSVVNGALRHRGFARTDQASDDTDIRRGTLGLTFGTCHTHEARDAACAAAACANSRAHAWCSTERTKQPGGAIIPARHERRATHVARTCVFGSRFLVIGFAGMLTQPLSHLSTH